MIYQRICAVFVVTFVLCGCVSAEVRDSVLALQRDHETYRKAVVPNPSYNPSEAESVEGLGTDISNHLTKLEELTR